MKTKTVISGRKVVDTLDELEQGDMYQVEHDVIVMIADEDAQVMILTGSRAGELIDREDYQPELIPTNKIEQLDLSLTFKS